MNQVFKTISSYSIRFSTNGFKHTKALSSISKDITKQTPTTPATTDLLISNFKNAKSVSNVLELVNSHNSIMNSNHTILALRRIFTLQKNGNSDISTSHILRHPDFEKICNQLKYQAGTIELNEVIEALKVMSFLGVPSNTTIYQILLQLLKHTVNEMSLQQIIFTDFLLSKVKPSPLAQALQIALPIVYDIQLPIKLDRTNISSLPEHLYYVSKKNISESSVMLIVNALMTAKVFDAKSSVSIMWSICDMQPNLLLEPLFNKAIQSLLMAGYSVPYHDLETIISKMLMRYSTRTQFYYNETFFDYCANAVITQDLGFEVAVHLLRKFLRVTHMNRNLLDYISEKCYENADLIENGDPLLTHNVIRGCALTDFRPKHYNTIKESFLKIKDFNKFMEFHLIRFQTALSILNIYIPEILEKALNEDYLRKIFRKNYMLDFENVLLITQSIESLRPEYSNYIPSDEFLYTVKSRIRPVTDYPLEGSLQHVFGGENFVKTSVFTKTLHHIDHLIHLKKGGFASALNPGDLYVEDVNCESPSQIVLIMALRPFHYTINQQLLGATTLMLKTLDVKGYSVVSINVTVWKSLQDFEKIPYLMEAIKSKTECFNTIYDVS